MFFWLRKYLYIKRGHQAEEYGGEVFLVSSVRTGSESLCGQETLYLIFVAQ